MGHKALTRQKRKCRLARQMSMTMLTMQVRAMASYTGRSMARKGKATMAPPMPLTPDTKPPAIQARNTQISVIPGIRPSCGHGPPHQWMKSNFSRLPLRRRTAGGGTPDAWQGDSPVWRWPFPPGIRRAASTSSGNGGATGYPCLRPAPLRRGLPPERPTFSHRTASLPARKAWLAGPSGRGLSPARPACLQFGPRSPCLGRSRPFGNREGGKKT